MSGARIALSLAAGLARSGARLGAAALCGGSGQGTALILRGRPS
jgi:acetyl-CoA C-acetyltransferase